MGVLKYKDININDYNNFYVKVSDTLPIGTIVAYSGITAPSGYLICDGSAVSRTEYADLFKAIGTSEGSGDGLTTFNLPDLRGRTIMGLDGRDVDFDTIGKTGGSKTDDLSNAYAKIGRSSSIYTKLQYKAKSGKGTFDRRSGGELGFDSSSDVITDATELGGSISTLPPHAVKNFIIKASKKVAIDKGNVVDTLDGSDTDSAPSVRAVKEALVETYSTDEVKTNKVWIDGKPIYRKVYTGTADIQATSASTSLFPIDSGINIVKMYGNYKWSSYQQEFPFVWGNATVGLRKVLDAIHYYATGGLGNGNYTITIEYTKTTD